jgi:hypothetical protein
MLNLENKYLQKHKIEGGKLGLKYLHLKEQFLT